MILQEELKQLHKLDMSILKKFMDDASYRSAPMKNKVSEILSKYKISAESNIIVEPLKNQAGSEERRHTWKYVTDSILSNDKVAGIILRSNKRQLMGILKRYSDYYYAFADIVDTFKDEEGNALYVYEGGVNGTGSLTAIRNKMSKVVKGFLSTYPNAKKNWDIVIIEKDESIEGKRQSRIDARRDMEYKPHDKEDYENYISRLKSNLATRLEKYINSKLPDNISEEQLNNLISNSQSIFVKKIKIAGWIYELISTDSDISRSAERFNIECMYAPTKDPFGKSYSFSRYGDSLRRLKIVYETVGKTIKVKEIYFYDGFGFQDGIDRLNRKREELQANSQS